MDAEPTARSRPRWLIPAAAIVTLVLLGGLFWLFRPGGEEANAPVDVFKLPTMDGTLVVVEPPRLVLKPFEPVDGNEEIEFTIREQDTKNFDVAHLRSHSSIGLPTRLYYLEEGGKYFAVYKTDAPANSSRRGEDR
jgi:hypothetical protein